MAKESSYSALELRALAAAGASLASELSLEAVLQKVADLACEQVGARYGALSVFDEHGAVRQFITSGISDEDRARIGEPPEGKGLLGVMLREGTSIRVNDLSSDPRGAGFPLNHPEMRSLLGVPVAWAGQVIGNLYLADKEKGS
ncbi:MAG: GAF domain-containing protein, partial [Dehalococcoidia bacterium]